MSLSISVAILASRHSVYRIAAVGVERAHHFVHHARRLLVRPVRLHAGLVHSKKHAPVNRFESVAHVWERAADDHAHRVIEEARAHLIFELARLDPPGTESAGVYLGHPYTSIRTATVI